MNLEIQQTHVRFNELFGGDPVFEQKVLDYFMEEHGMDLLNRLPLRVLKDATRKPVQFRFDVEQAFEKRERLKKPPIV